MGTNLVLISLGVMATLALTELIWIRFVQKKSWPWAEAAASVGVLIGRQIVRLATAGLLAPLFIWVWEHRLWHIPLNTPLNWLIAFLFFEFVYYWKHRMHHQVRWMWACHRAHHSSSHFTILTTIRTGWTGLLGGTWLFFLAMVWLGLSPKAVFFLLFVNVTYQIWLHTETIPKLGPFEWLFNTPSHHRVHHAVNRSCLHCNYGGILIIYDRLFGAFAKEPGDEPLRYGLVNPELSLNPFVIALREYYNIFNDLKKARNAHDVIGYLFGPPGWAPDRKGQTVCEPRKRAGALKTGYSISATVSAGK